VVNEQSGPGHQPMRGARAVAYKGKKMTVQF